MLRGTLAPVAAKSEVPVFTLEVLMSARPDTSSHHARLANLALASVEKATPRAAIAAIVESAKKTIKECLAHNTSIPWLEPKQQPREGETRMFVPIHL